MVGETVWVVEPIGYDMYGIEGIYATLEGAKASRPGEEWVEADDGEWVTAEVDACANRGSRIYRDEIGP